MGKDNKPLLTENVKIKIKLLSHASLLINYKNFNLITDPWLKGLAFNNSWIQYPPPYKYSLKYKPNIILITHEHSDHLSLETLKEYNKNTEKMVYLLDDETISLVCCGYLSYNLNQYIQNSEPIQKKTKKIKRSPINLGFERGEPIKAGKKVRKHRGITQTGGNKGRLRKGYRYSGKKLKSGLPQIIKCKSKRC